MNTIDEIIKVVTSNNTPVETLGSISASTEGDLTILSYTREAMYENRWNEYEQLCRGLIINNKTGEIVARPFAKFFNWGQTYGDNVALPSSNSKLVNVLEKMDGSLGILYLQDGTYKVATRGSLSSDQAIWATNYLKNYSLSALDSRLTLLFEIIYPDNRIVVDYAEREDLVLLGAIDRFTGIELDFSDVEQIAAECGFSLPKVYSFSSTEEILRSAKELVGTDNEGYVLRYSDGQRFKIKGDNYLELHRVVSSITKKNVFDLWEAGNDTPDLPDEFLSDINQWYDEFNEMYRHILMESEAKFEELSKLESRREFAIESQKFAYCQILFLMYDNRELDKAIMKIVKRECLK